MIVKKVKDVILSIGNWIPKDVVITMDSNIKNDLGFDSLALIRLQVEIEDTFGLNFDPVDTDFVRVFSTVGNLVSYIEANYK